MSEVCKRECMSDKKYPGSDAAVKRADILLPLYFLISRSVNVNVAFIGSGEHSPLTTAVPVITFRSSGTFAVPVSRPVHP